MELVVLSATGALSPGPLTFALLAEGAKKGWKAGLYAALGHVVVEVPLILLLALGASALVSSREFQSAVSLVGGLVLAYYTALSLKGLLRGSAGSPARGASHSSPFILGALLTGLNPHFLLWWATIGVKIVVDILSCLGGGWPLVLAMYPLHAWLDLVWLPIVAFLGSRGRRLGQKPFKALLAALTLLMAYFAASFTYSGLTALIPA